MTTLAPRILVACLAMTLSAHAVILFGTGDPSANTTAPSNDPAASGWNYQGQFGGFSGTPIAPHFFLSATHVGQAGGDFVYGGVHYTLVASFPDPYSDLTIWQVVQTFPTVAPLYTKQDESGKRLVVIGRGTQRDGDLLVGGELRGWGWGAADTVQRWGENRVASIVTFTYGPDDAIYATFDQNGLPSECHLSSGDSSGGVFIEDDGVWKLAGINYAVDGYWYADNSGAGEFVAALFDTRGYYVRDAANYVEITGTEAVPSGFYATRISSKLTWIHSVIDPTGDVDGDNISNLLAYALALNGPLPHGYGSTILERHDNSMIFNYEKLSNAATLHYRVKQSTDLVNWTDVTAVESIDGSRGNVAYASVTVPLGAQSRLFLRLHITQDPPPATWRPVAYKNGSVR